MILLLTNASVGEIMVVTGLWLLNLRRGCTLTIYHGLVRVSSAKVLRVLGYHGCNVLSRVGVLRVGVDDNVWVWSRLKFLRVGWLFGCGFTRLGVMKKVEERC